MYTDKELESAVLKERVEIVRWIYEYAEKVQRETGVHGVALGTVIRDVAGKINTFSDKPASLPRGPGTNTGHGWVWPRPDGMRARCGGPGMCEKCNADQALVSAS